MNTDQWLDNDIWEETYEKVRHNLCVNIHLFKYSIMTGTFLKVDEVKVFASGGCLLRKPSIR